MSQRFEMRLSDDLLARVDAARGGLPRATWMKRALEKALDGVAASGFDSERVLVAGSVPARPASPRASEERQQFRGAPYKHPSLRASSLAKVGVKPIPKRGEK